MPADSDDGPDKSRPRDEPKFEDEEFVEVLRGLDYPHVIGTADVAEAVGCHDNTALTRLNSLCEAEKIRKQSVGKGQRVVWFLPEEDLE